MRNPTKATETKQIDFHRTAKFDASERFGLLGADRCHHSGRQRAW